MIAAVVIVPVARDGSMCAVRVLGTLVVASLALAAVGCSSGPTGPEIVSWQLADGRDCFTSGINTVEARTSASLETMPIATALCTTGLAPGSFTVDEVPGDGTLYLDGVDPLGVGLYHGELSLDTAPPGTGETRLVTLYAAAAQ
jgi:hypothetical protein